jgi:hypothetical protein
MKFIISEECAKCTNTFQITAMGHTDSNKIFIPNTCQFCNKIFCPKCMLLVCIICHNYYACHGCSRSGTNNKCHRHQDIYQINCEVGPGCLCGHY